MNRSDQVASSLQIGYRSEDDADEQRIRFGYDARLDGTPIVDSLSCELPPLAADLLEIAASVYAIDRSVRRPRQSGVIARAGWGRKLFARIPVRSPERWQAHDKHLIELLEWLTDDKWELVFEPADNVSLSVRQGYLFDTVPKSAVPALFSGGLDSASGLANELTTNNVLAISVSTNSWMTHVQDRVLASLQSISEHTVTHLRYRINLVKKSDEASQRSRGFLFLAVGVATAWWAGRDRLRFFENGVGAINLPYLRSQLGAEATRSAHPKTLFLMETLVRAVSGGLFSIEAPYFTMTKAQLVGMTPQLSERALSQTVSCDTGFSNRVPNHEPCGICTSCLLRRQAVLASGRTAVDQYQAYRKGPVADHRDFKAMLWQASRLASCLNRSDPWEGLVDEFPEVLDAVPFLRPDDLVTLFCGYSREWQGIARSLGVNPLTWFQQDGHG